MPKKKEPAPGGSPFPDFNRDYGMGPSGKPVGKPTWKRAPVLGGVDPECPNCGADLCEVKVVVEHPMAHLLRGKGNRVVSRYLGCPACPYASPAMMTKEQEED